MPSSSTLFLNTVFPPIFSSKPSKSNSSSTKIQLQPKPTHHHRRHSNAKLFRASASSSSSWVADFDLYELLGVESSSDQLEIKRAYRALQKRCHPDIAGPAGHDMAIILNDVYSLLSDPNSRSAYDQEQAKLTEFRGYTGKPLYSTWFGSENEERAVFVDEVKCVGCLKCALHANRTFAIESVYGRARVITQWADPEDKIIDAIQTCPVDCISIVERSNLAALEFLMSKQPRGNVRMTGGGSTGGVRVSNIFVEINKFQKRFEEMNNKASRRVSKDSDLQSDSRMSAVQGIRSISNWWYWQSPLQATSQETNFNLIHIPQKPARPSTDKLKEAATRLKSQDNARTTKCASVNEEYWSPVLTLPRPSDSSSTPTVSSSGPPPQPDFSSEDSLKNPRSSEMVTRGKWNLMSLSIPTIMAAISATAVGNRGGEMSAHRLSEHIAGAAALEVVNSFEMQVILAGITWFVIGLAVVGMLEVVGSKVRR